MIARNRSRTLVFAPPFRLAAVDAKLPPGRSVVATEEELIQALSFPANRRLAAGCGAAGEPRPGPVVNLDPAELDTAIAEAGAPAGPEPPDGPTA